MFRHHFPLFSTYDGVYLDNAATTHKPNVVLNAMQQFQCSRNSSVHRGSYALSTSATLEYESARKKIAKFIKASSSDEVVFTSGATESLNGIAISLSYFYNEDRTRLQDKSTIVICASEHHANILPWQRLAKEFNLVIRIIELDTIGELNLEQALKMINNDTLIFAMAHVSNALGSIYPIKQLVSSANKHRAISVIDGTQAAAHLPINVVDIDCDFYVFSGHKMYGPTGIGVLYGKKLTLDSIPPWKTGGEMVLDVNFHDASFLPSPAKFEAGTPNIAGVIGLAEAANFITEYQSAISQHEHQLYEQLVSDLSALPNITMLAPNSPSISLVSFIVKDISSADVATFMNQHNVALRVGHHCAMPLMQHLGIAGTLRISIACYNTKEDISRCLNILTKGIALLNECSSTTSSIKTAHSPSVDTSEEISKEFDYDYSQLAWQLLSAKSSDETMRQLMLASRSLVMLSPDKRTTANKVMGCESNVWIDIDENGRCCAYSDSKIIRGILAVLIEKANQLSAHLSYEQAAQFNYIAYLNTLKLSQYFSQSRRDGVFNTTVVIQQRLEHYTSRSN